MKKRTIAMIVSLVLALALGLGGTLAYLTDTDADVNTMVLGNVQIVQNEQEWNAFKTALKAFTNDKPLIPYVGDLGWENTNDQNGAYRRFTMSNVVDKYVTVTNTGNSDAYVRTIIALEMGSYAYEEFNRIGVSINKVDGAEFDFPGAWEWPIDTTAEIDGKQYNIMVAVHQNAVKPGETTIPSLLQVYLSKDADNADVQKLDGNKNGKYDILVLSQAVQAAGFSDAETALNEAFGEVDDAKAAEWFADPTIGSPGNKNEDNNPPAKPIPTTSWADFADISWFDASQKEFFISTPEQLAGISMLGKQLAGKTITLTADIDLGDHLWQTANIWCPENKFTFDGGNHIISNLYMDASNDAGFIGSATGTIKNVKFDRANLKTGGRSAIIAAKLYGDIINCHVFNSCIEADYWAVGAIAGLYNGGDIKDCTVTDTKVKSTGGTGGIVGVLNETGGARAVTNCHVKNVEIVNTDLGDTYTGTGLIGMINLDNSVVTITGSTVEDTTVNEVESTKLYGYIGDNTTIVE